MKLVPLVLNLLLVAAALLIYDTIRKPAAAEFDAPTLARAPETGPLSPPPAREMEAPGLRGDEAWRVGVERRLSALESIDPELDEPGGDAAGDGPSLRGGFLADEELWLDEEEAADPEAIASRFSPAQIRTFRALLETVEQQRAEERTRRNLQRALDQAGVQLTDAQREDVLEATLASRERIRDAMREAGDLPREERRTLYQSLTGEYRQSLEAIVPAAEVDAIMQAMSERRPGRRPGGGGGRAPR